MTFFDLITTLTVLGGLLLFSTGLALAVGKGIAIGDAAICAPGDEDDSTWLDDQPHEVDTEALINAEFVAIISSHWMWPFDREEADQ